ncbi:hypothetical protein ABPG72_001715 [Tetrahymena utriculariae]
MVAGSINEVLACTFLEQIFVVHYHVDYYSTYTYKLQGYMQFSSSYDQEKVVKLHISIKNKIAITQKSKQLIITNFITKQSNNLNPVQQIQGVNIDDSDSNFYVYGSSLRIYNFDLNLLSEITKEGQQSYQQCIVKNSLIICKFNFNTLSIFNKKTFSQIANQQIINQPNTFQLFVDQTNSQIFVSSIFVQEFDFTANSIGQILSINQKILYLQLFGDNISILTQIIYFYKRQTLVLLSQIKPFGGGNLIGYYYLSDFNTVEYYADEIRYGQIFYYNLNTYQDDGFTIGSYPELGMGQVVNLFYDSYNSRLNYIDSADIYFNNNDNQKSTVIQSDKSVQFFFKYLPPLANDLFQTQYYIFDNNSILYFYNDFTQVYLTYFSNPIGDAKQINEYQLVTLIFDDKILTYTQKYISNKQISSTNFVAIINSPKIRKFLTNQLILTYDWQIILVNYLFYQDGSNNWIKFAYSYGQNGEKFKNYISYGAVTQQKTIFSLSSGRLLLYDESIMQVKQILPPWQPQLNTQTNYIKYYAHTSDFIVLGYQLNFVTVISAYGFSIVKQLDVSTLHQQVLTELGVIFADEQNSRIFVSYMYSQLIYVLDLQSLSFQRFINFPNNQYNRISSNNNFIFAYSNSLINIFQKTNLEYIPQDKIQYSCYSQIRMFNRIEGQKQFQLVYSQNNQNMEYRINAVFGYIQKVRS